MKNNKLNLQEWHQLVGKSIMAFCNIELVTYECLMNLPSEHIFDVVSDLSFAKRVDLISCIIADKDIPENLKNDFLKLMKKAKVNAEIRNLIVHNPLFISFYEQQNSKGVFMQPEIIRIKKRNKVITIEDLKQFTEEVEKLSNDLHTLMKQIFQKKWAMPVKSTISQDT